VKTEFQNGVIKGVPSPVRVWQVYQVALMGQKLFFYNPTDDLAKFVFNDTEKLQVCARDLFLSLKVHFLFFIFYFYLFLNSLESAQDSVTAEETRKLSESTGRRQKLASCSCRLVVSFRIVSLWSIFFSLSFSQSMFDPPTVEMLFKGDVMTKYELGDEFMEVDYSGKDSLLFEDSFLCLFWED